MKMLCDIRENVLFCDVNAANEFLHRLDNGKCFSFTGQIVEYFKEPLDVIGIKIELRNSAGHSKTLTPLPNLRRQEKVDARQKIEARFLRIAFASHTLHACRYNKADLER